MRHATEPALLAIGTLEESGPDAAPSASSLLRRLRYWLKQQTAFRVEDEVVDSGSDRSSIRLVLPLVTPILAVPALLLMREPGNFAALVALVCGTTAILYGMASEYIERRSSNPFWIHLLNAAVFAALISVVLWTFLVADHPRPHTHWVVFFVYFLLIGSTGLSDDPRQPMCAGAFSIIGYLSVLPFLHAAAASGTSAMAERLLPEFEWVANAAKVTLLGAATILAVASAKRGRTVRRMSLRDGLTGLLNRHAFDQCLERLAQRGERYGRPMIIAMLDIDHFKELNDTHGHPTGDAVLRWVGAWLQRSFRSTDVVARYGGEEFVVAFLDTEDERVCERLERLRDSIENTTLRSLDPELEIGVTVSMGVARLPSDGPRVEAVLARADECLYRAKHDGRNRIVEAGRP